MSAIQAPADVLSDIAKIEPGSYLAELRQQRPEIVQHTQATFLAIFEPEDESELSQIEREVIAVWVATLASAPEVAAFHRARLIAHGEAGEHLAAIGISVDSPELSQRERALLKQAEILTVHPATATRADVDALQNAGVSPTAIVTLSQLVAFLSFEIRTIAALRALDGGQQ
jgi:CMD domain protein